MGVCHGVCGHRQRKLNPRRGGGGGTFPQLPSSSSTDSQRPGHTCTSHTQSTPQPTQPLPQALPPRRSSLLHLVAPEPATPRSPSNSSLSLDAKLCSSAPSWTRSLTPGPPRRPPLLPPLLPCAANASSIDPLTHTRTSPVASSPPPSLGPAQPVRKRQLGFSLASSSAAFAFSPIPAQPSHDSSAFSSASESPSVPPLQGFASAAQVLQKQREPKNRGLADFSNGGNDDDEPRSIFQTANQGRKRQQVEEQQLASAKAAGDAGELQHAFEVTVIGLQYYEAVADRLKSSSRFNLLREPKNEHDENAIAVFLVPAADDGKDDEEGPGTKVGYVERKQAYRLAEFLDEPDDDTMAYNTEICAFARCIRVVDVQMLRAGLGEGSGDNGVDEKEQHDDYAATASTPKVLKLCVKVYVSDRRRDAWHALQQAFPSSMVRTQDAKDEQEEEERVARAQQARNLQAMENVMSSSSWASASLQGLRVLSVC